MKNQIFTLLLCAIAVQGADAKVRTTRQMVGEAARVLATKGNSMKAKSVGELKVLKREAQVSIVGYENSRNVVIANDDFSLPTGINKVTTTATNAYKDSRVYSIDGQVMGNDINAMGKGLYIVNGKKVMK